MRRTEPGEVVVVQAHGGDGDHLGNELLDIGVLLDDTNNRLDFGGGSLVGDVVVGLSGSNTLNNVVDERGDNGVLSRDHRGEDSESEGVLDGDHFV